MEGERSLTIVTRARVEKWKGDKEERTGGGGGEYREMKCKNKRKEIKGEARGKRSEEKVVRLMERPEKSKRRKEAQ